MASNLPELIQNQLLLPPLEKIDPNKQNESQERVTYSAAQAAISAMLTGLFKFTRTLEGAALLLNGAYRADRVEQVFGEKADEVVQKVASYNLNGTQDTRELLNTVGNTAVELMLKELPEAPTDENVRNFFSDQRHNILVYLPPDMQLGSLLEDNTLDDRTNKMEGPVSGLMHTIEGIFSSGKEE